MIAIDTNLLVYAHRASTPEHRAAQRAIEDALGRPAGCGIAAGSVAEFYAAVTHAGVERPSTPREAASFLAALRDAGVVSLTPSEGFTERLLELAGKHAVRGHRIFDLQIALTAIEHGARELWSHDKGFVKVPGLKIVDPL